MMIGVVGVVMGQIQALEVCEGQVKNSSTAVGWGFAPLLEVVVGHVVLKHLKA